MAVPETISGLSLASRREFLIQGLRVLGGGAAAAKALEMGIISPFTAIAAPVSSAPDSSSFSPASLGADASLATRELIGPQNPFNPIRFVNPRDSNYWHEVYDSTVKQDVPIEIKGTFESISSQQQISPNSFDGFILSNGGQAQARRPEEVTLELLRSINDGSLILQHRYGGQRESFDIGKSPDAIVEFSLTISADGKSVSVETASGVKNVPLTESLFSRGEQLRLFVATSPHTETRVHKLSISDPPEDPAIFPPGEPLRVLAQRKNILIGTTHATFGNAYDTRHEPILANQFNQMAIDVAWAWIHPDRNTYDFSTVDQIVNFAKRNGMEMLGKPLIWGNSLPRWLTEGNFSGDARITIMQDHIKTVMEPYRRIIPQWGVVTEAVGDQGELKDNFWLRNIGPDYVELAFRAARAADPDALLLYNEYGIATPGPKTDKVFEMLSELRAKGLVDELGVQMHVALKRQLPSKDVVKRTMERFKNLGLRVFVSEIDVDLAGVSRSMEERQQMQADFYRDMIEIAMEGGHSQFLVWGFEDKTSWLLSEGAESPHLFNSYKPKPSFFALQEALAK